MIAASTMDLPVSSRPERGRYPLTFWCYVFFMFVLFVAPQNIWPALQDLHPARVSFGLAIGVYLIQAFSRREQILPSGREFRLLVIFTVIAACSIPFSKWPGGSVGVFTDTFAKSLLVCILSAQLLTTLPRLHRVLWFLILFGIIDAAITIVKYHQGELVEGYRASGAYSGLVTNPNDLALTLNLIIPFALAFFTLYRSAVRRWTCAVFICLAVVAIFLAYSRGGMITLMVIIGLYVWKMTDRGNRLKYGMPLMLLAAAFLVFAPSEYEDRLRSITDFSKDKVGSAPVRWENTVRTMEVIGEHPLLGVGLGMNVLAVVEKGSRWSQVHNVYLEVASEIGIPGMIVYIMMLMALMRTARQVRMQADRMKDKQGLAAMATATEISLWAFATAALFHPMAYHFYFFYTAGFALALKNIAGRMQAEARAEDDEVTAVPIRRWRMSRAMHG